MFADISPPLWPLVALYPEIHYRFRLLPFSRYFRRQPEIITDLPRRLEPNQALPILLLVKDADKYALEIEKITLEARCAHRTFTQELIQATDNPEIIKDDWWHKTIWLDLPAEAPTEWFINVYWEVKIRGRNYRFQNDNLPGLSPAPLQVTQSGCPLPRRKDWHFGDLHVHTAYTADQVEFGAPLTAYPEMGLAQGIAFAFLADHSYDLDDLPGSYHQSDPQLQRFHQRSIEISELNNRFQSRFALLPGLELSAGNHRGQNVHLLLLGQRDFLPGSGDSAEKWLKTRPELSLAQALDQSKPEILALAAHPLVRPPFLERWLLRRGCWEEVDLNQEGLAGLQVWNGSATGDFQRGLQLWVEGLLKGKRWRIYAGSDAHGNFNRFRQVGFPLWKLTEAGDHVFGKVRTGVYLPAACTEMNLLEGLKSGSSLITDGPFADLQVRRTEDGLLQIQIEAESSSEFGLLDEIIVYGGKLGGAEEEILRRIESIQKYQWACSWSEGFSIPPDLVQGGYLRLEAMTNDGHRCLTNPIFTDDRVA